MRGEHDVLIVGGGLNGATLALALAAGGISSALIEPTPPARRSDPEFDGRAYALALTTRRMLAALGLWGRLAPDSQPILDIKVSDGRPGEGASPLFLHFDHAEIEDGAMGHMVEDRHLRAALAAAIAAQPLITEVEGAVSGQGMAPGAAGLTLADGRTLTGRLIAAADGRASPTALRAGIRRSGHDYHQTSLVAAIAHARPHHGTAHQFFTPSGPLAILPLKGDRSSIVWTEHRDRADAIMALDEPGYLAALGPRFGDFLGTISLAGRRYSYPLGLTLAERLVAERLVLVGDAAHGIHPLAGQGLNLGLRDVAALAETLILARRRGEDIGAADVLARYQRWRRFDVATLALATDGINRAFSNDNPLLRLGRDLALGAINALPAARRALIREAAGLTGELPLLMRGRPV